MRLVQCKGLRLYPATDPRQEELLFNIGKQQPILLHNNAKAKGKVDLFPKATR